MSRPRPTITATFLWFVAVVTLLVAVSCNGGSATSSTLPGVKPGEVVDMTGRKTVQVQAIDDAFQPRYIKVTAGTKVEFTNAGQMPHNVLAAEEGAFPDVDTDKFMPGDSADVSFDDSGAYPYYCSLHGTAKRGMNGGIVVVG